MGTVSRWKVCRPRVARFVLLGVAFPFLLACPAMQPSSIAPSGSPQAQAQKPPLDVSDDTAVPASAEDVAEIPLDTSDDVALPDVDAGASGGSGALGSGTVGDDLLHLPGAPEDSDPLSGLNPIADASDDEPLDPEDTSPSAAPDAGDASGDTAPSSSLPPVTADPSDDEELPLEDPILLIPPDSLTINAEQRVSFVVRVENRDKDGIVYEIDNVLSGATINAESGQFAWTPTNDNEGVNTFTVLARRGGEEATATFSITVNEVYHNQAPVFDEFGDFELPVEEDFSSYDPDLGLSMIHATDIENDSIIYSAEGLPYWASFNSMSQVLEANPPFDEEGERYNVTFIAMNPQDQTLITRKTVALVAAKNPFLQEYFQSERLLAPGLLKRSGDWDSEITVQNATADVNSVTVNYFCVKNALALTEEHTLSPFAALTLHTRPLTGLKNGVCDPSVDQSSPEFTGSVELVGTGKITGVIGLHRVVTTGGSPGVDTDEGTSYPALGPLGRKLYFPAIFNNPDNAKYYSRVGILNGGLETSEVTLDFVNRDTGIVMTGGSLKVALAPLQKTAFSIDALRAQKQADGTTPMYAFLQTNARLGLVVTAAKSPLSSYVNTTCEGSATASACFRSYGSVGQGGFQHTLHFPLVYASFVSGSITYKTELAIQNASAAATKIKLTYYSGATKKEVTSTTEIPPNGTWLITDADTTLRPANGFKGTAIAQSVTATGEPAGLPIVGLAHINGSTARNIGYAYNALGENGKTVLLPSLYKAEGVEGHPSGANFVSYPFTSCVYLMNTADATADASLNFYLTESATRANGQSIAVPAGQTAGGRIAAAEKASISIGPHQHYEHCMDTNTSLPAAFIGSGKVVANKAIVAAVVSMSSGQNRELAYSANGR